MRPRKARKRVGVADEHPSASEAILEPAAAYPAGARHATPWDEPSFDWGRRGYGALRVIRRSYNRERYFETW